MDNLSLITVTNQFDRTSRDHQLVPYKEETLLDIRNKYFPAEVNFSIAINGQIIPEDYFALTTPNKGDCVVFTSKIEYVGAIAAAVATFVAELVVASAPYWVTFLVYYGVYALVYGAIVIGAGLLVNALFSQSVDTPGAGGDQGSQLYSWNPVTTNKQGGPVPKLYGKCKVYGNVISVYTEAVGEKSYLNILININLGVVKSISEFKVNDQDIDLFEGVTVETRYGYINQPTIPNFNDTKIEYSMAKLVTYASSPEQYETLLGDFDRIEVDVSFVKGLYGMDSDGNVGNRNVELRITATCVEDPSIVLLMTHDIRYTEVYNRTTFYMVMTGTEIWSSAYYDSEITASRWSCGYWEFERAVNRDVWCEIEVGSTNFSDHRIGDVVKTQTVHVSDETGNYIITRKVYWRWILAGTHVEAMIDHYDYAVVSGATTSKKTFTFWTDITRKGRYTIKVWRLSADTDSIKTQNEMTLSSVRLVYKDDYTYPRHTLIGVKALASDQLSGSLGFSCIVEASLVRVWDGVNWKVEYSNNPAWVCYDILTQPVFNDPSLVYIETVDFERFYRCIKSHTAATNTAPYTGANWTTYWEQAEWPYIDGFWYGSEPVGWAAWIATHVYSDGYGVSHNGKAYTCTAYHVASTENEPGVGANWESYWEHYLSALTFYKGDYIRSSTNQDLYECILGHKWDINKKPGYAGGAAYWKACKHSVGASYLDITDAGVARYDGINPSKLDHAAFKEWADWCDVMVDDGNSGTEHRFEFNGGFDSEASLWEQAIKVCIMSRAMLYWNGNQISVIIDRAGTPVQLFSVGNVVADSFEETFLPYEDRAGEMEIDFINKDNNYQKDTFTIFNATIDKPTNKVSVQLLGCTSPSQAWRSGQFLLLCNQYLKRTITFKADIDAIACTLGDIINFQHDLPRWGLAGGRLVSATINTVTLDTEVTIEADKTYAITIRLNTDVIVTKTISTSTPGTYTQLSVSVPFVTIPSQYDVYSFGESEIVTKPFRVQSIERSQDTIMTISCIEYDENIYSVDTGEPVVPPIDYSGYDPISPVTDLSLNELVRFDESGNIVREIEISFKKPSNPLYKEAIIYYMKNGGPMVQAGTTEATNFKITGCAYLDNYYVLICTRSWIGVTLNRSLWTTAVITMSLASPQDDYVTDYIISGLEIYNQANDNEFVGRDCKFVWRPASTTVNIDAGAGEETQGAGGIVPLIWFRDYEVQIYDTSGNLRRTEYVTSSEYTYSYEKNCEDSTDGVALYTFEIRVKGRDLFGHISSTAARLTATNTNPTPVVNLQAAPVISGVCFTWNKNTETDFDCYYVRTAINSVYGDWKKISDNVHTRSLTDAEITAYGEISLIAIDVQVMDVFGLVSATQTVSDNAATINDNLFQFAATKSGGTGNVSDLYDGARSSGGVVI